RASHPSNLVPVPTPARPRPRSTRFPYTTLFRSKIFRSFKGKQGTQYQQNQQHPHKKTDVFFLLAARQDIHHCRKKNKVKSQIPRSEEHTSELQSRFDIVCRLLLAKKTTRQDHTP